jgi:hypothetical protein
MSKHEKVSDEKKKVGKAGSPPSGTENEKARDKKDKRQSVPKVDKGEVGGGESGGGLH